MIEYYDIACEVFMISIMIIFLFAVKIGEKRTKEASLAFTYIFVCSILHSASNAFGVAFAVFNKAPMLVMGSYIIYNFSGYLLFHAYTRYFTITAVSEPDTKRKINIYNNSLALINFIVTIILLPTGKLYYVDEACKYFRGPLFGLTYYFLFLGFAINIVLALKYAKIRSQKISFLLFTILPILGNIATLLISTTISFNDISITLALTVLFSVVFIKSREEQLINEKKFADYRIHAMISQIRPHFIYNSLTAIYSLCDKEPQTAKKAIGDFSKYLRMNLDSLENDGLIPFTKELEHIEHYLNIEKLRYEERLEVNYNIEVTDFEVPILSIQPIVENAVKHGISKKVSGGCINISSEKTKNGYIVTIEDTGNGFDNKKLTQDTEHIGLKNAGDRIEKQCGGSIAIDSKIGKGTKVTLKFYEK